MKREESIKKHSSALNPRVPLIKILMLKGKFQAFRITRIMLILEVLNIILFVFSIIIELSLIADILE